MRNNAYVRYRNYVAHLELADIENLIAAHFYAKRLKHFIFDNLDFKPPELKTLKNLLPRFVYEQTKGRFLNREETRKGTGFIHLTVYGSTIHDGKSMTVTYYKDAALFVEYRTSTSQPRRTTNRRVIVKILNEMIEELMIG